VGANFLRLMRMVDRGWPLPLGAVNNRRDLIFLGNLVDAIETCITHSAAANKTFLLTDGDGVSTPELIRRVAAALGRPARLLPIPESGLRIAGILTGKSMAVSRLLGSLMVDSSTIRQDLDWSPLYSMREGLLETAKWYRCAQKNRL
jgi:nucleoside-diphosphate-sugar epimerase